jgi:hypothetical protein
MGITDDAVTLLARVLAVLLLATALLLSWPGVRAVRADEPDMTPIGADDYGAWTERDAAPAAADAEACEDPSAKDAPPAARARGPLPASPEMRPGQPGMEARPGVVILNGRGYNYGAGAEVDPAQWAEAEREGARPAR